MDGHAELAVGFGGFGGYGGDSGVGAGVRVCRGGGGVWVGIGNREMASRWKTTAGSVSLPLPCRVGAPREGTNGSC